MSSAVAQLKKPQLRGLLHAQIKRNLLVAIGLCITAGVAHRFLVCEPRKKRFADFYKTYDPEKEFQRMKKLGLFQAIGPDD